MKKILLLIAITVILTACNKRTDNSGRHYSPDPMIRANNIKIRFSGRDENIPKEGQLLIIKCSLEDEIVVEPATLDDCRRILEEHGKG